MTVVAIHVGPIAGATLRAVRSVRPRACKGLEGDRHVHADGAPPGEALTLVEEEVVSDVGLPPGGTRRQVTVRGVRLGELIGSHFRVGPVLCYGVEICEPCLHLQQLTWPGIIKELVHRGGLNAEILNDGVMAVGEAIAIVDKRAARGVA